MARSRKSTDNPASSKRPIEQYDHKGQQRKNNPHVGLVTPDSDHDTDLGRKAEHTSFEVPTSRAICSMRLSVPRSTSGPTR